MDEDAGVVDEDADTDATSPQYEPDAQEAGGPCPCALGDGAYCGGRANALAAELDCDIPRANGDDIVHCEGGVWTVADCDAGCSYAEGSSVLDDSCNFEAPPPADDGRFYLPFGCGDAIRCSNGAGTTWHSGDAEHAYDFAVPVGTDVRAMRGGTVSRVRNITGPGDPCYSGGDSSCANEGNSVEVRHDDGTVALYLHLERGTVTSGESVSRGDVLGQSGNTGYSTGPHLHVQLQSDCGIWWCQSIALDFAEGVVATGSTVTSENCR